MIRGIYAIKDVKTAFWQPWVHHNDNSALREFSTMVNGDNVVGEHPGDFELWKLGTYDDLTGAISPSLEFVVSASSLKKVIDE